MVLYKNLNRFINFNKKYLLMNFLLVGAILGCLTVIIGAFGAHGLKDILDEYGRSIFEKGVLYQMFHTIAILIIGVIQKVIPTVQISMSGWLFLFGIIIFSGSLYILAITGNKSLGMITPIGGLLFIAGWIYLAIKLL